MMGSFLILSHVHMSRDLGLHEGDPISPTLYLFFIDTLLQELYEKHPGIQIVNREANVVHDVVAMMQADDLAVVSDGGSSGCDNNLCIQ